MSPGLQFRRGAFRLAVVAASLLVACALALSSSRPAHARAAGLDSDGCFGCHRGGVEPKVTIQVSNLDPPPGSTIDITVIVTAASGNYAGFLLSSNGKGSFTQVTGEGTRLWNETRVGHASTKTGNGTDIRWRVRWNVPSGAGGVDFTAAALGANGNRATSGDAGANGQLSLTWGCGGGREYWLDQDNDGHGSKDMPSTRACETPQGWAANSGDCDDFDSRRYPTNTEVCDGRDNDCDGMVDDGLPIVELYEDKDGDGHGVAGSGMTKMACGPGAAKGWGVGTGDCKDDNKDVFPTAMEICNNVDDDCDGRTDEEAREVCGVGWCRQYAPSCGSTCVPGKPRAERCNGFDDDCDGETDEGADICPAGQVCSDFLCRPGMSVGGRGGGTAGAGASAGTGGSAGGQAGQAGDDGDPDDGASEPAPRSGCAYGRSTEGGALACLLVALWVLRRRFRG